jgi:hypothetical protein
MYKKLKTIELAYTPQVFGLAIAVLLDEGVKTISNLTDEEIKQQNGNSLISDEFWQTIIKVARSIATTIKDDPTVLISYCQDNHLFNSIKPTKFEEEEIAKIVWTNQDIIEAYKQKVGENPTEEVVYEILDYLNIDSDGGLQDCSQGWEVINVAIDEYLEVKR